MIHPTPEWITRAPTSRGACRKRTKSGGFAGVTTFGEGYLAYGLSISNRLLIITNSVSIVATGLTLVLAGTLLQRAPTESKAAPDH